MTVEIRLEIRVYLGWADEPEVQQTVQAIGEGIPKARLYLLVKDGKPTVWRARRPLYLHGRPELTLR